MLLILDLSEISALEVETEVEIKEKKRLFLFSPSLPCVPKATLKAATLSPTLLLQAPARSQILSLSSAWESSNKPDMLSLQTQSRKKRSQLIHNPFLLAYVPWPSNGPCCVSDHSFSLLIDLWASCTVIIHLYFPSELTWKYWGVLSWQMIPERLYKENTSYRIALFNNYIWKTII